MVTLQARHLWRDSLAVNAHGDIALRLSKSDAALKDSVTGNGERRSRCVRKAGGPGSGQGGGGGASQGAGAGYRERGSAGGLEARHARSPRVYFVCHFE